MANDWPTPTVIDLQDRGVLRVEDGNHGEYRPRPSEFTSDGCASFIRAADMNDGQVLFETADRINSVARKRIRKGIGCPGDVLFSHKGTVGKLALVPDDAPPYVCSPQTTFWRTLDKDQIDRRYLYCYLRSPAFRQQYAARKGETDMADYVSLTAQRTFKVTTPPIDEQRRIGDVIGQLDDKIELNRRMNETLEATARAIFRSWFVDFDPVVAKAEGRQPALMSADTAALFPDHFEETPQGPIPAGWKVKPIGDAVRCVGGGTPRTGEARYWENGTHPFATPRDMSKLTCPVMLDTERHITDAGVAKISSGQLPAGTVLLSSRAPIGYLAIAQVPLSVTPPTPNSTKPPSTNC